MASIAAAVLKSKLPQAKNSEDENYDDHEVEGEETDFYVTAIGLIMFEVIAIGAFACGLVTFIMVSDPISSISSIYLMVVIAPLVAYQKYLLREFGDVRDQTNELRDNVNHLDGENKELVESVNRLASSVKELDHVEDELDDIVKKTGADVNRLVAIVKENGELQEQIKKQLRQDVVTKIMRAILTADRDHDFILEPPEVEFLVLNLKNIPGVVFNEKRFRRAVQADKGELTMQDVFDMVRELSDEKVPENKAIFSFKPRELLQN